MAKVKHKEEVNENDYLYELISFFTIILSIILLGGIGILGFYGNLLLKIVFGEWYFLILFVVIYASLKYLIKGKGIDLHTVSFQGFIFMIIALNLLSHLAIFNSLGLTTNNVFKQTINLYKTYFNSYNNTYFVGSGIICLVLFQICITLLGKTGVVLMGVSLMLLGTSYLMNKSVFDFFRKFKHYMIIGLKFKGKMRKYINKMTHLKDDRKPNGSNNVNLSILDDKTPTSNSFLQEEIAKEYDLLIEKVIKDRNLPVKYLEHYVGYCWTTYAFELLSDKLDSRLDILLKIFDYKAFYMLSSQTLMIDVKNQFKELLTLKNLLLNNEEEYLIPIGENNMRDLIIFDINNYNSLLICGEPESGIKTCIRAFISSIIFSLNHSYKMIILDLYKEYKELSSCGPTISYAYQMEDINKLIDEEIYEFDKRLEILKYLDVKNYVEANEKITNMNKQINILLPRFIIINVSINLFNSDILKKIEYLSSFGKKMGINIILISKPKDNLSLLSLNQYNKLIFKISDLSISLKLTNTDIATTLMGKGDFIYMENKKISHGQAAYLSSTDFLKIINKFIS